jgi:hypothetical protein
MNTKETTTYDVGIRGLAWRQVQKCDEAKPVNMILSSLRPLVMLLSVIYTMFVFT